MSVKEQVKTYALTKLAFNIGIPAGIEIPGGHNQDCNSGGSVICLAGTGGCGAAALTCVGTSCSGKSATMWGFDAEIYINPAEYETLQKEVMGVVQRFAHAATR
ncbi:MAG: hypothetical protein ABI655_05580 [Phenylobacterium sp.]